MTIDDMLGALAASPVPPGLDGIDAGVRMRIDAETRIRRQARHGALAVVGAATLAGVAGAALPAAPARSAAVTLVPTALSVSTLLGGE